MLKRLGLMLVLGALVAGCGDDDDDGGGIVPGGASPTATATATATADAAATPTATATEDSSGGTAAPSDADVQAAVDACKQAIAAQPQLSDSVRADLEETCEEAAEGDEDGVREATKEVCEALVKESGATGDALDQALAACEQSG